MRPVRGRKSEASSRLLGGRLSDRPCGTIPNPVPSYKRLQKQRIGRVSATRPASRPPKSSLQTKAYGKTRVSFNLAVTDNGPSSTPPPATPGLGKIRSMDAATDDTEQDKRVWLQRERCPRSKMMCVLADDVRAWRMKSPGLLGCFRTVPQVCGASVYRCISDCASPFRPCACPRQ